MQEAPFQIRWIDATYTDESIARGDAATEEMSENEPADRRAAIEAMESDCWDNVDERGDGSVIAYPADWQQDYRTGDYSSRTLVIESRRPHWTTRLVELWSARQRAERERFEARLAAERARRERAQERLQETALPGETAITATTSQRADGTIYHHEPRAVCPRCGSPCPIGPHNACTCAGCFTSFRADDPTACLTPAERESRRP